MVELLRFASLEMLYDALVKQTRNERLTGAESKLVGEVLALELETESG